MTRPDWRTLLQEAADTQHTAALTWRECRQILDALPIAEPAPMAVAIVNHRLGDPDCPWCQELAERTKGKQP